MITETIGGVSDYEDLDNKPSINGVTLIGNKTWEDLGLPMNKSYTELNDYVMGEWFNLENTFIGEEIPATSLNVNSKYLLVGVSDLQSNKFRITGYSDSSPYFLISGNIETGTLVYKDSEGHGYTNEEITINIPEGVSYIVFNFTDTDETTPKVEMITESIGTSVKKLESNIVLGSTPLTLDTGFYFTGNYLVLLSSNPVIDSNEIIYFDKDEQILWCPYEKYMFDDVENEWGIYQNDHIENELTNSRSKLPTSQAVYNEVSKIFYNVFSTKIVLNSDGTITNDNVTLPTGYYMTSVGTEYNNNIDSDMGNCILYYDSVFGKIIKSLNTDSENLIYGYTYNSVALTWNKKDINIEYDIESGNSNDVAQVGGVKYYAVKGLSGNTEVVDTIPASGSNNNVPSNNAVRKYVKTHYGYLQLQNNWTNPSANNWNKIPFYTVHSDNSLFTIDQYGVITFNKNAFIEISAGINPQFSGTSGQKAFRIYKQLPRRNG
jgi:hypothetical protein